MKKTYTKKQRYNIYKSALKMIEADKQIYLCHAVRVAAKLRVPSFPIKPEFWVKMLDKFPEVLKRKPRRRRIGCVWWRGSTDKWHRIKALKQCIKETRVIPSPGCGGMSNLK